MFLSKEGRQSARVMGHVLKFPLYQMIASRRSTETGSSGSFLIRQLLALLSRPRSSPETKAMPMNLRTIDRLWRYAA
jgi:hypothetical protein